MTTTPLPTQEALRALLRYDPESGRLYWRPRPVSMFDNDKQTAARSAAVWNGQNVGNEALCSVSSNGYRRGTIFGLHLLAHRVIWKMINDEEPDEIDHINGNRLDNRLCNLRSATKADNLRNAAISKRNSSGATGVTWSERRKHWRAFGWNGHKQVHIGSFPKFEDAVSARRAWATLNGFHKNHGRLQVTSL